MPATGRKNVGRIGKSAETMGLRLALVWFTVGLAFLCTVSAQATPSRKAIAKADACTALQGRSFDDARIVSSQVVSGGKMQIGEYEIVSELPDLCRVVGSATPVKGSRIGFEVWLPLRHWSGRIHMIGNGGYSPAINRQVMANLVRRGEVTVATDTGHTGGANTFGDLEFGFDNSEGIRDWAYRAVHRSIVAGKAVAKAFYGTDPRFSYFSGCSTGGHQGLMSAQRFPDDFDGILAGAPGANRTNLNLAFLWQFLRNHETGDNLSPILTVNDLKLVKRAALKTCDADDGVEDGILADPRKCGFEIASLTCSPGQSDQCLFPRKVAALAAMYRGPVRSDNAQPVYAAWPIGSEYEEGQGTVQDWSTYWANPGKPDEPQRIDYLRRWAFHDVAWDWWSFDWANDVDRVRAALGDMIDATSPDLDAFRKRGGKLILFVGWQDPVVSAYDTIGYFDRVSARYGSAGEQFTRLYTVPGMGHCALGNGATNFSSSTRDSTPLKNDARHDVSLALQQWVERGSAPREIIAARYVKGDPAKGLEMTRPICPHPATPVYSGAGDTNRANSFKCK